ncbi:MAG: type III polyketide synthase [Acidobacteria bacterium]|nr:MAG: type III polyketide synthase [Acidobacteriota bacterium]
MRIAAVATALPPNRYDQRTLTRALLRHMGRGDGAAQRRLSRLHERVSVGARHLALRLEEYERLRSFRQANDAWIRVGTEIGSRAVREALERSGVPPERLGAFFSVSVTGIATPSLEARVMNALGLPSSLKRVPVFGLGCVAGAAGLARAADYVRAYPDEAALLLSVELCSLTLQRRDLSVANLIASGLFGDGAAAAVVAGAELEARGPRVVATRSVFYPDTERVMGWDIGGDGFRVVLSPEVPEMVRRHLRRDVDAFLAEHGLDRAEISRWICHPGGPKVIEAIAEALELPAAALEPARRSLREFGNLSSASVLFVLAEALENAPPPGSPAMLLAMGPGFCSELVLLEW